MHGPLFMERRASQRLCRLPGREKPSSTAVSEPFARSPLRGSTPAAANATDRISTIACLWPSTSGVSSGVMGFGDSGGDTLRPCPARDASLRVAIARAPLLALLTPSNFEPEVERVHQALATGTTADLDFRYDRDPSIEPRLLTMLDEAARVWRGEDELGALYADKAEEVALELRICEARERDDVASLAAARFRPRP